MAYKNYFFINTQFAYDVASIPLSLHFFSDFSAGLTLPSSKASMETVLKNGIKVFRNASVIKQISGLVAEYSSI